jgi:hypothetical protein
VGPSFSLFNCAMGRGHRTGDVNTKCTPCVSVGPLQCIDTAVRLQGLPFCGCFNTCSPCEFSCCLPPALAPADLPLLWLPQGCPLC